MKTISLTEKEQRMVEEAISFYIGFYQIKKSSIPAEKRFNNEQFSFALERIEIGKSIAKKLGLIK